MSSESRRDVFISHASEDKDEIARPLVEALKRRGVTVWFDEYELELGDSLRGKISAGLRESTAGVVILSPNFFSKPWPQWELDGLTTREMGGSEQIILPVWHNVDHKAVLNYSAPLADRVAAKSSEGVERIAERIAAALGRAANFKIEALSPADVKALFEPPFPQLGSCPTCRYPLQPAGSDRVCRSCGWSWSGE